MTMRPGVALRDRLAKRNEISQQRLTVELMKLEKVKKSDLRMIETARQRFRTRYKKLETEGSINGSNTIRMYETHNPGFCYHCTGAIRENGSSSSKETAMDSYEMVRAMLFTDDEVDPDKVLCLHLLAAHSAKRNDEEPSGIIPVAILLEKSKKKRFAGAWNSVLPCYVIDNESRGMSENVKLHEDPLQLSLEEQATREFEERYRRYIEDNAGFSETVENAKQIRMVPNALGKRPIISPHVYSLLGVSHELKMKQAMAGRGKRNLTRSNADFDTLDESLSFGLDEDLFSRITTDASQNKICSKSTCSPSRRSFAPGFRPDRRGITMLKSRHGKEDLRKCFDRDDFIPRDLVTIKSSYRTIREVPSKSSSVKSPFRNMSHYPSSMNSFFSEGLSPGASVTRCRRYIYLNSPIKCMELRDRGYETVLILVNYQIQALIHCVLEVLERVNPEKTRKIIEVARSPEEIRKTLMKSEVQNFLQSLIGQPFVYSPENFVVSFATVANEIDRRFEGILERELIALTLEMPSMSSLDDLIAEIRNSIFVDPRKKAQIESLMETSEIANDGEVNKQNSVFERYKVPETNLGKESFGIDHPKNNNHQKYSLASPQRRIDQNPKDESSKRKPSKNNPTQKIKRISTSTKNKANRDIHKIQSTFSTNKTENLIAEKNEKTSGSRPAETKRPRRAKRSKNSTQNSQDSKVALNESNASKCQYKPWRTAQDPGHLDADHVMLRRMTNAQRILVGQMCASLKTRKINNEGVIKGKMPLVALIAPVLSQESIRALTRGTVYSKADPKAITKSEENTEDNVTISNELTGPVLAKVRRDIAENETERRLKSFLEKKS